MLSVDGISCCLWNDPNWCGRGWEGRLLGVGGRKWSQRGKELPLSLVRFWEIALRLGCSPPWNSGL